MTNSARHLAETIHGISRLAEGAALHPQLMHSSIGGPLVFTDPDGNPIGVIGGDGKGGIGAKPWQQVEAPMPTTPEVTADAGFIRVKWDGLWADADDPRLPADPDILTPPGTQTIEVHVSLDPNFVASRVHTFAGSFDANGDGGSLVVGPLVESGEYWVALRARMTEGHVGELSGKAPIQVSGVQIDSKLFELALRDDEIRRTADGKNEVLYGDEEPERRPVLDQEGNPVYDDEGNQLFEDFNNNDLWFGPGNMPHLYDEETGEWVSAGDARVGDIEQAQEDMKADIESAWQSANGKNSIFRQAEEPDPEVDGPFTLNDIWFKTNADGASTMHQWDGSTWEPVEDARQSEIERAQDELREDLEAVVTDGSGRKTFYQPSMPSEGMNEGDLWYDTDDHDRPHIYAEGQWTYLAQYVTEEEIAEGAITTPKLAAGAITAESGIIGSINAGTILFGEMDGQRVKARSLAADRLIVGQGGNLIPWDQVLDGATAEPHEATAGCAIRASAEGDGTEAFPGMVVDREVDDDVTMPVPSVIFHSSPDSNLQVAPGENYTLTVRASGLIETEKAQLLIQWIPDLSNGWVYIPETMGQTIDISRDTDGSTELILQVTVPDDAIACLPQLAVGSGAFIRVISVDFRRQAGATLIEDGAITTPKIATGAITAESGIIANLDADTIKFGQMDGARIKTRSIRADQLLSGGSDNLLPAADGNWLEGKEGWMEFEEHLDGSLKAKGAKTLHNDDQFYVPAGEYLLEVTMDASVPGTVCLMQLEGLGTTAVRMTPDGKDWQTFNRTLKVENGGLTRLTVFANYKDGASNENGWQWFKDLSLRAKAGATLIQDGAITTGKIATGAITAESGIIGSLDAGVITTGELRGELIRAGSIAAAALAADAIDGKTITGALIRTAATGARVETTKQGLWQYNRFNQTIASMADGKFTAVGDFQTGLDGERRVVVSNQQFTNGVGLRFYPDATGHEAGIQALAGGGWTPGSMTITSATAGGLFQEIALRAPTASDYGGITIGTRDGSSQYSSYIETNENGRIRAYAKRGEDLQLWTADGGNIDIDPDGDIELYCRNRLKVNQLEKNNDDDARDVVMSGDWYLGYSTSSRRYKVAEEPIQLTIDGFEDKLLSVDSKTWFGRSSSERYAAHLDDIERGEEPSDDLAGFTNIRRAPGMIAEDLHDAGLGLFVYYNDEGDPDGVKYDRIGPALIPIVRSLRDRIESLEAQLASA